MCIPEECQAEDFKIITDSLVVLSKGLISKSSFTFPSEFSVPITPWRIMGFILFAIIGLFLIMGYIVEVTPLFNKREINQDPKADPAMNKTVLGKAFISFSPSRNLKKLFYSKFNDKDDLKVLNGVKFFSFLYVILGHAYMNVVVNPTANVTNLHNFVQPLTFQIVPGGFFAVDVFFFMSAFLGVYLMISKFANNNKMNIPMIFLHRYMRLAPSVLLIMLFAMTFFQFLGEGPLWPIYSERLFKDCPRYIWSYLLFLNSVVPHTQPQCMQWLWYLSHDFLFFLTLPFQVLAYLKKRIVGYILAVSFLVANIGVVAIIVFKLDISLQLTDQNHAKFVYFKPWARFGSYQVGILFGMLYSEYKNG